MERRHKIDHQRAVIELLQASMLPPEEAGLRLGQAMSPSYWTGINPQLSIGSTGFDQPEEPGFSPAELAAKLERESYVQIDQAIPAALVSRMRDGIERLRKEGWPLVFGFVYDEFWLTARLQCSVTLLSAVLGPGYKQIPHIWTHCVSSPGRAGWPPHTDGCRSSNRVSVWTALTDATLENGCMYVVLKDPSIVRITENFPGLKTISKKNMRTLLKNTRALPVSAGTLLCWDHSVIHWGSVSKTSVEPRIATSLEFIAEAEKPRRDEEPLLDARKLPTFSQRLNAIGKGLLAYQEFEPLVIRYAGLAKELVKTRDKRRSG